MPITLKLVLATLLLLTPTACGTVIVHEQLQNCHNFCAKHDSDILDIDDRMADGAPACLCSDGSKLWLHK